MEKRRSEDQLVRRKRVVSVVGGHECSGEVEQIAHDLGKNLAAVVDVVCCGGLEGVMRAVCAGVKAGGGQTLGIIPGYDCADANEYVDVVIPTGMGLARNVLVVTSADVVVALPGAAGTLSEIAYGLQFGKPVISLGSWDIPGVVSADSVDDAITRVRGVIDSL